jgi:hypothetical protein
MHIEHQQLIASNVGWFQFVAGSGYQVPRLPQFKILNKTSQEFFFKIFLLLLFFKKSWLGLDMLLVGEKIKSRF